MFLLFLCLLYVGPMPSAMIVIIRSMCKRTNSVPLALETDDLLPPFTLLCILTVERYAQQVLACWQWIGTPKLTPCFPVDEHSIFFYKGLDCVSRTNSNSSQHLPGFLTHFPLNIYVNLRRSRMTTGDRHRDNLKTSIALQNHRCEHL